MLVCHFYESEKDGLYMKNTSIIPNHVSETLVFDKDTGWRENIPAYIEPGTRVLCLYRVSTDTRLYLRRERLARGPHNAYRKRRAVRRRGILPDNVRRRDERGIPGA